MAITTLDGALEGMRPPVMLAKAATGTLVGGRPHTLWALAGAPGPGAYNATLNGVVLSGSITNVNGQIPRVDPVTGNAHLARFQATATQAGVLMLVDRLWHNGGFTITLTTAQAIVSPAFPARDINGSTNGEGVLLAVEVSATTGAGVPTITVNYTNSDGVAGRIATNINATLATSAAGAVYLIGLQAGDKGVRSVQSLTLSATWTSGTINLVAYRLIASLELPGSLIPQALDFVSSGAPRLYNGTVPYMMFIPFTTTSTNVIGSYVETQG